MPNVVAEPTLPFVRMNNRHVAGFSVNSPDRKKAYELGFLQMLASDFEDGRFKSNACIIDASCRKFEIRDVVNLGVNRSFGNLIRNPFAKRVNVEYLYDTPIQLTFDEARTEIVELICSKKWFSKTQDREGEMQFRERMDLCEDMNDLIVGRPNFDLKSIKRFQWIGGISHYGQWVG